VLVRLVLVCLLLVAAPGAAAAATGARGGAVAVVRLSQDPYTDPAQHATEVEPDSVSYGSSVVAVFQVGRYFDGGASNIGFAFSADAGRHWRSGFLPQLTLASTPAGAYVRASDPSVAYDALHGRWLVSSLGLRPGGVDFVISRSADGVAWEAPVTAAAGGLEPGGDITLDKEWIACDNGAASPYRGHCYLSYSDFPARAIATRTSSDGGLTWSEPAYVTVGVEDSGPQPVVRPDGTLVLLYSEFGALDAVRSTDGGATFTPRVAVGAARAHSRFGFRAAGFSSAEADAAGTVYVAWHDCRFRRGCASNDVVVSHSPDGVRWTAPARLPVDSVRSGADHVLPGLGVDPRTRGRGAHLAVTYYSFRSAACDRPSCLLDVSIVTSANGGRSWSRPRRLDTRPMQLAWLPQTNAGRMVGDYFSTSFAGGRAVGVFALAAAPSTGRLNQSVYAASVLVR
jgi:hypothetical protein